MTPLPTREVAERLGVPISTLHGWIAAERITPIFKAPGLRGPMFFDPTEVDRLAAELADEAEARAMALRGATS